MKAGLDYAHSELAGVEKFVPAELVGTSGAVIERIDFSKPSGFEVSQNETAFYISDQWTISDRLSFDYGVRVDSDTITSSTHFEPRGGVLLSLTGDGKTLLKAGAGIFYDRVPLMLPRFSELPGRTVSSHWPGGAGFQFDGIRQSDCRLSRKPAKHNLESRIRAAGYRTAGPPRRI